MDYEIKTTELISVSKTLLEEINNECFGNQLQVKELILSLSNSERFAAQVKCKFTKNIFKQITSITVFQLKVSSNFNWTYSKLKNTLCHELIHIYEAQILKQKPGHGQSFKAKMMEINYRYPHYTVNTKHHYTPIVRKERKVNHKPVTYIVSEDHKKIIFLAKSLEQKMNMPYYKNLFVSNFGQNFSKGKICSSILSQKRYKTNKKLKTYYLLNDKIKEMIQLIPVSI